MFSVAMVILQFSNLLSLENHFLLLIFNYQSTMHAERLPLYFMHIEYDKVSFYDPIFPPLAKHI
jgi:hypothetical protein